MLVEALHKPYQKSGPTDSLLWQVQVTSLCERMVESGRLLLVLPALIN